MGLSRNKTSLSPLRIGVLGGMGPAAGVRLQELIVEMTPASSDQEHIQVVCFTNPHIPDRTASLQNDGGRNYLRAMISSLGVLEAAGVNIIAIPCNTAHARLNELQAASPVRIVDMISLARDRVRALSDSFKSISLFATDGTLANRVYHSGQSDIPWSIPSKPAQEKIMECIYATKAGERSKAYDLLRSVIAEAAPSEGDDAVLLGCTELSLFAGQLMKDYPRLVVIDPLEVLAGHLVKTAKGI